MRGAFLQENPNYNYSGNPVMKEEVPRGVEVRRIEYGRRPAQQGAYHVDRYGEREASSSIETLLGGLFCFLLFIMIIFCIAYPLTMYRENPHLSYSDDNWWCYHCVASNCASRCWYGL
jgi:hypothetical protein